MEQAWNLVYDKLVLALEFVLIPWKLLHSEPELLHWLHPSRGGG